ncbi:MAG: PAS domain S-box protein [Nitrospinae bacterium]|nr:PAS domain S-box protein [Nitrospinota bacterium]
MRDANPDQAVSANHGRGQAGVNVLLAARLAVISFFMGLVVFYQAKYGSLLMATRTLLPMAAAYLVSIIYSIFARRVKNVGRFILAQFLVDVAIITGVIHFTGGADSPFSFLYIFVIIGGAIFLSKGRTYVIASAASVAYGLILDLEFFEITHPYHLFPPIYEEVNPGYIFMKAVMNITVFYLVAYLSAYLTGLLSKSDQQLIKQSRDFTLLKAFHENVIENMGSGFIAVDMGLTTLSHNPAAERILELGPEEIRHKRLDHIIGLPALTSLLMNPEKARDYQAPFDWSFISKVSGGEKHLTINASEFIAGGETQGFVIVFQDVTGHKMMERQVANAERMAAIGRVAAGIAHEIRNPLASLSGSIQMLSADLEPVLGYGGRRLVNIIMREADRLNGIINQFLQYASPPKLKPQVVDVGELLKEMATLLLADPRVQGRIECHRDIEPGLFANVDPEQFRQVIWNLCVNAIDAMENGGELMVKAARAQGGPPRKPIETGSASGPYIIITVEDNGGGIPPDQLDKIFEPFYTTKSRGTGLGLPTASKIVESHGGKITVRAEPEKGTTFSVWLPEAPLHSHAATA